MSSTAIIRKHVEDALPEDHEVRKPSRGARAGIEIELPDGAVLLWRLVPGEPWEGNITTPDGDFEDLPSVPKGLPSMQTAAIICDIVQRVRTERAEAAAA